MQFDHVQFAWPDSPQPLLDAFSISFTDGDITAIVGPSGCGKSTILRLAAGLLQPTGGTIHRGQRGGQAFVFQSPNLLPWRSLRDNVALPLELLGTAKAERQQRAQDALARVGLGEDGDKLPSALSGGMRMRASLARALITAPTMLLMDEPFSALDTFTRRKMHREFLQLWERTAQTVLFVTHDLEEAVLLADRVIIVSGQPLSVVQDLPVSLPRPRQRHSDTVARTVRDIEAELEDLA